MFVLVNFAPYKGTQLYTYQTELDVAVNDFVVVDTPSNGFQVVKVQEVAEPFETDFVVKHVVDKVDLTSYRKLKAANKSRL